MRRRVRPLHDLGPGLLAVEKPARYLGGEYGSIRKSGEGLLTIALCFPDLYEIGMSNNAIRILYEGLNRIEGVRCERVFAPAPDFEALLDAKDIPLYTLESGIALCDADILGCSIGYELAGTSLLSVLQAGGIPLRAEERGGESPIVIAGGPAISNPHPLADFLDAAFIGEAEGAFISLVAGLADMKRRGAGRSALLERLSTEESVWLPSRPGRAGKGALRAQFPGFSAEPYRTAFPVATVRPVQDHGTVEIMRGCPNGCRFCHAGYYYRPQRIKRPSAILAEVDYLVRRGGYREITLASLSSGDYPGIGELLAALNAEWRGRRVSFQLPSLKVNSFTLPILKELSEVRKSGLTFAVETPIEAWQHCLNKDVSFERTVAILEEARSQGFRQAKFYFMIGLPVPGRGAGEADGIVEFFERLSQRVHLQYNATIGIFVPKPHTPYQWCAQLGEEEGLSLIADIRHRLRHLGNLKLSYHSPFLSLLEGVISRGDERVGALIAEAFARGARLDAWEDRFDRELWRAVLDTAGWNVVAETCRARDPAETLPWDDIRIRVSKASLYRELQRSENGVLTSACTENCTEPCGSCGEAAPLIASAAAMDETPVRVAPSPARMTPGMASSPAAFRMLFQFAKGGSACYYPHLSVVEALERAFLIADLPLHYSEGFNPSPRLEVLPPLPLAVASRGELGLVALDAAADPESFMLAVNASLPEGLSLLKAQLLPIRVGRRQHSLGSLLWGSRFLLEPLVKIDGLEAGLRRVCNELGIAAEVKPTDGMALELQYPEPHGRERSLLAVLARCYEGGQVQSWIRITRQEALADLGAGPLGFFDVFAELGRT